MLMAPLIWTFVCAITLTLFVERLSRSLRIIPKNSYRRKAHENVPLLGGVAVVAAICTTFVIFPHLAYWPLVVCFLPLMILGFMDDLKECPGWLKFAVQVTAACLWAYALPAEQNFFVRLTESFWAGQFLSVCFTIGLINALNLIDGLDGQASTVSIITLGALAYLNQESAFPLIAIAALAAFMLRNFRPAKIYLGEVGSSFLGFALATQVTSLNVPQTGWGTFLAILFLFSVPFSDTVAAMYRRIAKKVSLFSGDREHIHHRLIKLQFSTAEAWFITNVMVLCGALTCVLAISLEDHQRWILFAQSGSILSLMFFGIFWLERRVSQRLLGLSSQFIAKYMLPEIKAANKPAPTRALVFDMLPYFRELQGQGILSIQDFMKDLAAAITKMGDVYDVRPVGSYSLIIFFYGSQIWQDTQTEQISKLLYGILHDHRIVRSTKSIPEGVSFLNEESLPRIISPRPAAEAKSVAS